MAQKCVLVFTKGKKRSTQPHCKYDEWKMMRYERSIQYDTIQYIEWAMMGCKGDQRILWIQRKAVRNGGRRGKVQKGIIQFSCKSQSSVWNLFFSTNLFNVIRAIKYAVCFTKYVTSFGVFVSRPYIDQNINSVRLFTALGLTMGNLILQATSMIFEAPRQGLHSSCNCVRC